MWISMWAALAQAATLAYPAEISLAARGSAPTHGSALLFDTFVTGDDVLVRTSAGSIPSGCTISDGIVTPRSFTTGAYTVQASATDPRGVWTVECPGYDDVRVRFVHSAHHQPADWTASPRIDDTLGLWFARNTPADLADAYSDATYGRPSDTNFYNGGVFGTDDERWVGRAGWWTILNTSLQVLEPAPGSPIDCGSNTYACIQGEDPSILHVPSGSQQGPLDSASLQYAAAGDLLLRLSLAALVAQEYDAAGYLDTSGHHFVTQKDKYLETAIWWGTQLAGMSQVDFENTYDDGSSDLYRANMILSLSVAYDWLWPYMDAIERHDWLAGLFEKAQDFYVDAGADAGPDYPAVHLQSNDAAHYSSLSTNKVRKVVLNGHTMTHYDAVGVAYLAMEVEMCGWATSCATGLPYEMYYDARAAFDDAEAELGDDGANHNGVFYGLDYLGRVLEFREAPYSRGASAWGLPWHQNTAAWLDHYTLPNRHRSWLADSVPSDADGPSWQMALVATTFTDAYAQHMAWLGHNPFSHSGNLGWRDVRDLLFWDDSVVALEPGPGFGPDHAEMHPHACFPDREVVALRTDWTTSATWLGFDAGPRDGGHGDPAAGGIELYRGGYLLTSDGDNNARRSAAHSIVLLDGFGQHGDGQLSADVVPDEVISTSIARNNADLKVFLDNSDASVDLVTVGVDLTEMYRYDDSSVDLAYPGDVDVDPNHAVKRLTKLERYLIWSGGDVLVYDRWAGTGTAPSFEVSSLFTAATISDTGVRSECTLAAASTAGGNDYFAYTNPSGSTAHLRYPGTGMTTRNVSGVVTNHEMDVYSRYTPGACASGTPDPLVLAFGVWQADAGGGGGGHVRITPLEAGSTTPDDVYVASGDGRKVIGEQLRRTKSGASGMILTGLRPYVGTPPASPTPTAITSGSRVEISGTDGGKSLLALFANPGASSTYDSVGNQLDGVLSAVSYTGSASQPSRKAASMVEGTHLRSAGTVLVDVVGSVPASVGITYGTNAIWGTVDIPNGQSSLTLWLHTNGSAPSTSTVRFREVGNPASPHSSLAGSISGGGIQFTVYGDGQFQIDLASLPPSYWNLTECAGP